MAQRSPRGGTTRWVSRERSCPCSRPEPIRDVTSASSEARDSREPRESFTPALRASVGACAPLGWTNVAVGGRVRRVEEANAMPGGHTPPAPLKPLRWRAKWTSEKQGGKPRPGKNVGPSDEGRADTRPNTIRHGAISLRDAVAAGEALGRCRDGDGEGRPDRGGEDRARPPDRRLPAGTDSRCPAPRAPCRRSRGRSAAPAVSG